MISTCPQNISKKCQNVVWAEYLWCDFYIGQVKETEAEKGGRMFALGWRAGKEGLVMRNGAGHYLCLCHRQYSWVLHVSKFCRQWLVLDGLCLCFCPRTWSKKAKRHYSCKRWAQRPCHFLSLARDREITHDAIWGKQREHLLAISLNNKPGPKLQDSKLET